MIWHSEDLTAISRELGSDTHSGLTTEQAEERQREYGPNKLDEKPPRPWILRFLDQFKDVMVLILIGAAAVSLGLSVYNALQGREADWAEPIVILVIVVVNALLGVIQESRAQAALEALKNLSAPAAKVWRDGVLTSMKATDLVPGDVVEFEAGDLVPADCRLLSAASLQVDESALTGESVPVLKDAGVQIADIAPLGDRVNMAYAGGAGRWWWRPGCAPRWAKSRHCWKTRGKPSRLCSASWRSWGNIWGFWRWLSARSSLWWGCWTGWIRLTCS